MEDFYRIHLTALDNFDLPVVRFDRDGLMTYLNRAGERLLGAPANGHITLHTLFRDAGHYHEVVRQLSQRLRGEASAYEASFHRPYDSDDKPAIPVRIYMKARALAGGSLDSRQLADSLDVIRDLHRQFESEKPSADAPVTNEDVRRFLQTPVSPQPLRPTADTLMKALAVSTIVA